VPYDHAQTWATSLGIPYTVECSAYTGEGVDELFNRLGRIILTKIELGEIDPDDPASGIQYGDSSGWWAEDGGSVKSGFSGLDGLRNRRRGKKPGGQLAEWEDVFRLGKGRRRGCC
jgi:Ras-related protein Rab-4B